MIFDQKTLKSGMNVNQKSYLNEAAALALKQQEQHRIGAKQG
jgi:hypothetical protein